MGIDTRPPPSPQTFDFGPLDSCRWRLQITDPAIRLNVNPQGQINTAQVSYTYNETWIDREMLRNRGIECRSDVPVNSYNTLTLSSVRPSDGHIHISFNGDRTTKPGATAIFDGTVDVHSSLMSGTLKISRNDLTSAETAWIWTISLPVSIKPDASIK